MQRSDNKHQGIYLVTGAASGIGHAVTQQLLSQGKYVAAVDLHQKEYQKNCFSYQIDLMDNDAPCNLIKQVVSDHGPIQGIVHAAGFDRMEMLNLSKRETLESLFKIHAEVPLMLCSQFSKRNFYCPGGAVVLISSLSAHEGAIGHAAYAAAKGAVEGFVAPAAAELARKQLRLNAVVLGVVKAPMSSSWITNLDEIGQQALVKSYPLGIGTPEDVASMITFLLSEKARWITGQKFTLDGGHTIRA